MEQKKQYIGLDVVKFILSILVAMRHIIQVFFTTESRGHLWIGSWLSNLAVPTFFIISGFFLFSKIEPGQKDTKVIKRYLLKIIKMYVIWSILYWPIDIYNWYHGSTPAGEAILYYIQSFFFASSIAQLWYLPALITATFLIWLGYTRGIKIWQLLIISFALFLVTYIGDNWYLNEMLPHIWYLRLMKYCKYFLTTRNGVFYGPLYVTLGLLFAKNRDQLKRIPFALSTTGAIIFIALMYLEVLRVHNINVILTAIPAAACLFIAASAINSKPHPIFTRMRAMSEWIYLSHFYFFYFFAWNQTRIPVPKNNKTIMIMVMGSILLFAWLMTRLFEYKPFSWLKKLI